MRARFRASLLALSLTSALIPCAEAQMRMRGGSKTGRILFHSPSIGRNGLACINCHANFDEKKSDDGKIRAGHPLINSAKRQTWWGQDPEIDNPYPDIAHAAIVCVEEFMLNPDKLTAQQLLDLQSYLRSITRQPIKAPLPLAPAVDKTGEYGGFDGVTRSLEEISFSRRATPVIQTAMPVLRRRFPEIGIPLFTLVKSARAMALARKSPGSTQMLTTKRRVNSCLSLVLTGCREKSCNTSSPSFAICLPHLDFCGLSSQRTSA